MVYGHPPFHHLGVLQKMKAIPDTNHEIKFPAFSYRGLSKLNAGGGSGGVNGAEAEEAGAGGANGQAEKPRLKGTRVRKDVIECMKGCLVRDPKQRALIPDMLDHDWLSLTESAYSLSPSNPHVSCHSVIPDLSTY